MHPPDLIARRAAPVRLLVLDVDGVMTDGRIWFVPAPGAPSDLVEVKAFDASDGAGIAAAQRLGLRIGIVSGRSSPAVTRRAAELGIEDVRQGVREKDPAIREIMLQRGVEPREVGFVGDDIVDLPAMLQVGFPVAVANAADEVKERAAYVTTARGGRGAVREVVELILKVQGKWDAMVEGYLSGPA
jgi:3-deoxy-D-manno-octulosonate 8-phosphate phosphatase (KDO 8-P phosphatase)